jgi:hypothetical protein
MTIPRSPTVLALLYYNYNAQNKFMYFNSQCKLNNDNNTAQKKDNKPKPTRKKKEKEKKNHPSKRPASNQICKFIYNAVLSRR